MKFFQQSEYNQRFTLSNKESTGKIDSCCIRSYKRCYCLHRTTQKHLKIFSINLDNKVHKMLFVLGVCPGYLVLEENTIVQYKCTDYYNPKSEHGINGTTHILISTGELLIRFYQRKIVCCPC